MAALQLWLDHPELLGDDRRPWLLVAVGSHKGCDSCRSIKPRSGWDLRRGGHVKTMQRNVGLCMTLNYMGRCVALRGRKLDGDAGSVASVEGRGGGATPLLVSFAREWEGGLFCVWTYSTAIVQIDVLEKLCFWDFYSDLNKNLKYQFKQYNCHAR